MFIKKKEFKKLQDRISCLEIDVKILRSNLDTETIDNFKEGEYKGWILGGTAEKHIPTLKGQVNAILNYLNITVDYKPSKKAQAVARLKD